MKRMGELVLLSMCWIGLAAGVVTATETENLALAGGPADPPIPIEIDAVEASGTLATGYVNSSGWCGGPYIDLTAGAEAVRIVSFEMYFKGTVNRDVDVYWKAGTYVGSETNPGAWTLLGTVNVTPGGDGTLTAVNLGGVDIPAGQTYGFKVWDGGTGGASGPGLDLRAGGTAVSDGNLSLASDAYTCSEPFNGLSTGFGWQGTVTYGDVPVELLSLEVE
ncbi:MAG: hypothetical protein MUC56_11905 [Thermoanaerobaculales bacterium]|jgi:hypothetical protein|nr:hypothetical protein [Thermoanaerobaculales bacterium]